MEINQKTIKHLKLTDGYIDCARTNKCLICILSIVGKINLFIH